MHVWLEIALLVLLVLVNGLFAMAEFALLKANEDTLGDRPAADTVRALLEEPNRFLSTVQVAITAVGTLAGAFGGAVLAEPLGGWLDTFETIRPRGEVIAVGVIWIGLTAFSLVIGELVPKRLALRAPNRWSLRLGPLMNRLSRLLSPVVKLLSGATNLTLRLLGQQPETPPERVTEAEVRALIARAVEHGELKPIEHELAEFLFLLDDRAVSELMTPLSEVHSLPLGASTDEVLHTLREGSHSRYPVWDGSSQQTVGVVLTRDILKVALSGGVLDLKALLRTVPRIKPEQDMLEALEIFRTSSSSVLLVEKEEGGDVIGLLTSQDLLEAFAGRLHAPLPVGDSGQDPPEGPA